MTKLLHTSQLAAFVIYGLLSGAAIATIIAHERKDAAMQEAAAIFIAVPVAVLSDLNI